MLTVRAIFAVLLAGWRQQRCVDLSRLRFGVHGFSHDLSAAKKQTNPYQLRPEKKSITWCELFCALLLSGSSVVTVRTVLPTTDSYVVRHNEVFTRKIVRSLYEPVGTGFEILKLFLDFY